MLLRSGLKSALISHSWRHSAKLRHHIVIETHISDAHVGNSGQAQVVEIAWLNS